MKFKVGDTVQIVSEGYFDERLNCSNMLAIEAEAIREMKKYSDKITIVKEIRADGLKLDIDNGDFFWGEYEIDEIEEDYIVTDECKATDKQVGGSHYKDKKLQPWDIIDELNLNFYEGNALKYLIRYKDKNGVEDLKKAIHYIEKLIEDLQSPTNQRGKK